MDKFGRVYFVLKIELFTMIKIQYSTTTICVTKILTIITVITLSLQPYNPLSTTTNGHDRTSHYTTIRNYKKLHGCLRQLGWYILMV